MKKKNGFTLMETIVVIAIVGVVSIALSDMIVYIYRTNKAVFKTVAALEGREQVVMTVLREVRGATYGPNGEWPLVTATDSDISYYVNADSGIVLREYTLPATMKFHYFDVQDSELGGTVDVRNVARVNITASSTSIGSATLRNISH
jgi:prepilin-type N-terminal cleavage/methylation domain-containing protein